MIKMKYQRYRVYVEGKPARCFDYFERACRFAESENIRICNEKGIGSNPPISIYQGSGSDLKIWEMGAFGIKECQNEHQ